MTSTGVKSNRRSILAELRAVNGDPALIGILFLVSKGSCGRKTMWGFTRKVAIGGVKLWLKRDDVQGWSEFLHLRDQYHIKQQGVFPHLIRKDGCPYAFVFSVRSGWTKQIHTARSIILNSQGNIASWDGRIKSWYDKNAQTFKYNYWADFDCNTHCDEDWLAAFSAIACGASAIVRFRGDGDYFDFKVAAWNRRLIRDLMRVVATLAAPSAETRPSPCRPEWTGESVVFGPLRLNGDGSIDIPAYNLTVPPGLRIPTIRAGDFLLSSHPQGHYTLTSPLGIERDLLFRDGVWMMRN